MEIVNIGNSNSRSGVVKAIKKSEAESKIEVSEDRVTLPYAVRCGLSVVACTLNEDATPYPSSKRFWSCRRNTWAKRLLDEITKSDMSCPVVWSETIKLIEDNKFGLNISTRTKKEIREYIEALFDGSSDESSRADNLIKTPEMRELLLNSTGPLSYYYHITEPQVIEVDS